MKYEAFERCMMFNHSISTKGQLSDVSEGAVGAFGRVCYEVFELELGLLNHEPNVCKEAEEVLIENGKGGDVVF